MIQKAAETNTDRIELYTEPYASGYLADREKAIAPFVEAAQLANKIGLKINAGHDLSLENLKFFNERIPYLKEVSIDRKSTRLNSSHVRISYAVFCLKKKRSNTKFNILSNLSSVYN